MNRSPVETVLRIDSQHINSSSTLRTLVSSNSSNLLSILYLSLMDRHCPPVGICGADESFA